MKSLFAGYWSMEWADHCFKMTGNNSRPKMMFFSYLNLELVEQVKGQHGVRSVLSVNFKTVLSFSRLCVHKIKQSPSVGRTWLMNKFASSVPMVTTAMRMSLHFYYPYLLHFCLTVNMWWPIFHSSSQRGRLCYEFMYRILHSSILHRLNLLEQWQSN